MSTTQKQTTSKSPIKAKKATKLPVDHFFYEDGIWDDSRTKYVFIGTLAEARDFFRGELKRLKGLHRLKARAVDAPNFDLREGSLQVASWQPDNQSSNGLWAAMEIVSVRRARLKKKS